MTRGTQAAKMPNVEGYTTVVIPDDIHLELKIRAARQRASLQAILEKVLRDALGGEQKKRAVE